MGKLILGIVIGIVLVPLLVLGYLLSGYAPTAASDPAMPFEAHLADLALQARIRREAPVRDLSQMAATDLLTGADVYQKNCAMCHGLPDQPAPAIAQDMFPPAPQLMRPPRGRGGQRGPGPGQGGGPSGAATRPNGDFWRVKNGIRLTGMPSFENVLSEDQMWDVVGLLANRRNLPAEVKDALKPVAMTAPIPVPTPATQPASSVARGSKATH